MIYESVLLGLQRATHSTLRRLTTALADLNLTASEINALANLTNSELRTVSQLAAATGAKPSTMTSLLDRLEGRDLIMRCGEIDGDRRVVLISLTKSGEAVAKAIRQVVADQEKQALSGLPKEALAGFQQVLQALIEVDHE
ncbi:MAG TPA: MarR family transcriptional regulator [Pseudonocardiaceae bacterium]|nr:MarR family transcriptional regulator [Pseudonocardiaceae bacterium]